MLVKNFEDLEIWKEARRLTGEIYRLTKDSKFSKDFDLSRQTQSATVQSCQISPKGSSAVEIQSSSNFFISPKGHAAKSALNSMSPSINRMQRQKLAKI